MLWKRNMFFPKITSFYVVSKIDVLLGSHRAKVWLQLPAFPNKDIWSLTCIKKYVIMSMWHIEMYKTGLSMVCRNVQCQHFVVLSYWYLKGVMAVLSEECIWDPLKVLFAHITLHNGCQMLCGVAEIWRISQFACGHLPFLLLWGWMGGV